ncbi:hypothetical protein PIB30_048593 [Stylosanthes scabra]|uniref:Retrotransposon gag domain-containing protein n=1 Tax=Stylosanthes scabra TaxID=79078 RepID=A0ABU6ZFT4_9FABA|nr:hypothetical protein [Stylosanthes scabra]
MAPQRSTSTPDLLLFDPEIERTLCRARQVRRQIEFESNLRSQTNDLASENDSAYSSNPDFDLDLSSDSGTSTMGDVPMLTLKQLGGASTAMENQPARRTSGDEEAIKAFALPFSLERKMKDWYHTLPNEVTADWALFRKRFLEKYFLHRETLH